MFGKQRLYLLDELRGAAIILMVIYHMLFLLADVFHDMAGRTLLLFFSPAQPFVAGLFILISGICCRFSRSNLKRGLLLSGVALLLTLSTFALTLFGINELITFGVLHFLAISILLFVLFEKFLVKLPPLNQVLIFAALFVATANPLLGGERGIGLGRLLLPFPQTNLFPLFALGLPSLSFSSADYFPLIPWVFLFFTGTAIGLYAQKEQFPKVLSKSHVKPLQWVGRYSLWIYLIHQPVMYLFVQLNSLLAL